MGLEQKLTVYEAHLLPFTPVLPIIWSQLPTNTGDALDILAADVNALVGGINFQGAYNATTNVPNLTTPLAGAVEKGYMYKVSVAGTAFFGEDLAIGDALIANIDDPALVTDWTILEVNQDYPPTWAEVLGKSNISGTNDAIMTDDQKLIFKSVVNYIANDTGAGGIINYVSNKGHVFNIGVKSYIFGTDGLTLENGPGNESFIVDWTNGGVTYHDGTNSGALDFSAITSNQNWILPDATGTIALLSDIPAVPSPLVQKAGIVAPGTFALSGGLYKATVTFAGAFADALYAPIITGGDVRSWTIESRVAGSFIINSNSAVAPTDDTYWTATKSGESS